jgi:hypothetical protein
MGFSYTPATDSGARAESGNPFLLAGYSGDDVGCGDRGRTATDVRTGSQRGWVCEVERRGSRCDSSWRGSEHRHAVWRGRAGHGSAERARDYGQLDAGAGVGPVLEKERRRLSRVAGHQSAAAAGRPQCVAEAQRRFGQGLRLAPLRRAAGNRAAGADPMRRSANRMRCSPCRITTLRLRADRRQCGSGHRHAQSDDAGNSGRERIVLD